MSGDGAVKPSIKLWVVWWVAVFFMLCAPPLAFSAIDSSQSGDVSPLLRFSAPVVLAISIGIDVYLFIKIRQHRKGHIAAADTSDKKADTNLSVLSGLVDVALIIAVLGVALFFFSILPYTFPAT